MFIIGHRERSIAVTSTKAETVQKGTETLADNSLADSIAILDFGSQYSQLIARRVREFNTYSELLSCSISAAELKRLNPKGVILSGGPASVYEPKAPKCDPEIYKLGIPVLGVCYGMQLMAQDLGGTVEAATVKEFGRAMLTIVHHGDLFNSLDPAMESWMSHGDSVAVLPEGFSVVARTMATPVAAIADDVRKFYGVQFHPEVVHTRGGQQVLKNFVVDICKCTQSWTMAQFIDQAIEDVRQRTQGKRVLLALSGGVDSSTLAFLLHKAIGDNLTCMFIDQGFMRKNEPEWLVDTFENDFKIHVHFIKARDRFIEKLKGVTDPEEKRKAIGAEFIRVFEAESKRLGPFDFLAQGTLYPDVIESAGTKIDPKTGDRVAVKIKSHHNVGGLPKDLQFKLVEPFAKLFKDEVRKVAKELEVPEGIRERHPFPGPGLAIRVLGEVTKERLKTLREADWIIREEIKAHGLYKQVWQIFGVLLPTLSVGVMGDQRTYQNQIVIRAVTSEDGMTADWARLPYDLLETISSRIVNEVPGINRVVYDVTSKPPATIEWE
ncbi:MAG: glutamine-hydrolyzing GMP synthase [Cyanobacteria bacterium SZAS LIN-5]|nr:glutamine-hydrolyzing GMP synthase [Cyanobacteria bacterium SZAS LIN-5]RTL45447.1 MAG: glutamine-hydrolyzing GMP synthase [Candidatus Melainabacteria bacterium]